MHSCYLKLIVNFRKGKKYLYKQQTIYTVYGGFAISEDTLCKWLPMFKSGNFDLKVKELPGIPSVVDDNQIEKLIKNNPGHMTGDIAEILHVCQMRIGRHLKKFWYVNCYDFSLLHDFFFISPQGHKAINTQAIIICPLSEKDVQS